jgi:hypothetical protein
MCTIMFFAELTLIKLRHNIHAARSTTVFDLHVLTFQTGLNTWSQKR